MSESPLCILKEPKGEVYAELLRFALEYSHSFLLVWRDHLPVSSHAHDIKERLQPFLLDRSLARDG